MGTAMRTASGRLVKVALAARDVTLTELARRCSTSVSVVGKVLRGTYGRSTPLGRAMHASVLAEASRVLGEDLRAHVPEPESPCGSPDHVTVRTCSACRKANRTRNPRKTHRELSPEAQKRAKARAHANIALRRGQLTAQPCEDCGATPAEMHHEDYDRPLEVRWLCSACHRDEHRRARPRVNFPLAVPFEQADVIRRAQKVTGESRNAFCLTAAVERAARILENPSWR